MAEEKQAIRDWHTRARVRIKETTTKHSFDGEHTFQAGEIVVMLQWGRAGRTVDRDAWWTSYDIDGAWIVEASLVEVIEVIDEVSPFEEELPGRTDTIENIATSVDDKDIDEWLAGQVEEEEEDEGGAELRQCPYCYQMHQVEHIEFCPLNPRR